MPVKLYTMCLSPPVAVAMMICDIHKIPVEQIEVDFAAGYNYTPEYLKRAALAEGVRKPPQKLLKELRDACGFLEAFLGKSKFVAGDTMTLVDISIVATVSAMRYVITIDVAKYPNITAWYRNMEKQPFFQKYLAPGSEKLRKHLKISLDL